MSPQSIDTETIRTLAQLGERMDNLADAVREQSDESRRDREAMMSLQRQVDRLVVTLEHSTKQLADFAMTGKMAQETASKHMEDIDRRLMELEQFRRIRDNANEENEKRQIVRHRRTSIAIAAFSALPTLLIVLHMLAGVGAKP